MSEFVVRIPTQNLAGAGSDMRTRLVTWEWRKKLPVAADGLALDFSNTGFIEPWALALFTAYALRMREERKVPVRAILNGSNPSNRYIRQMGLEDVLASGQSTDEWDSSIQNTGLHVLSTHQDVSRFVDSAARLGLGEANETMDALKYGMAELGRNVIQHSCSPVGGIAIAQLFPDRKAIQISIADAGQGVFHSLKRTYPELSNHLEGLKLAVLPHVSGAFPHGVYSASENAGLGLFFCKEICWRAGGSFWLVSHDSLLGVKDREDLGHERVYRKIIPWEGTSVTMDLPEQGVVDFGGLLSVCRELAAKARSASGPAGLDFLHDAPDLEGISTLSVGKLNEDIDKAKEIRDSVLLPAVRQGQMVILDFAGAKFVTQSFAHALLNDVFRIPGSLVRLSFVNCTHSTQEAIAAVAAYAASYSLCV